MRWILALLFLFSASLAALAQQRFDFKVREDMFAGMDGDTAAFDRAMKLIDDTLATDPNHVKHKAMITSVSLIICVALQGFDVEVEIAE